MGGVLTPRGMDLRTLPCTGLASKLPHRFATAIVAGNGVDVVSDNPTLCPKCRVRSLVGRAGGPIAGPQCRSRTFPVLGKKTLEAWVCLSLEVVFAHMDDSVEPEGTIGYEIFVDRSTKHVSRAHRFDWCGFRCTGRLHEEL